VAFFLNELRQVLRPIPHAAGLDPLSLASAVLPAQGVTRHCSCVQGENRYFTYPFQLGGPESARKTCRNSLRKNATGLI